MHITLRCLCVAAGLAALASAQQQTILFTGRFPFQSLDTPNERAGGAITRLEEFDFSHNTPGAGAVARTLLPATAMQCYLGDGNNDGNYTKFAGWKTYFQNIGVGGIFVKASDRASVTPDKVFFSVRRNAATTGSGSVGALQLEVLTANGTTPYTLVPGDYVRLLPNGNVEFFMTAAQLQVAVGTQSGAASIGAGALLQAANGDLYYSPVDGGHWVNGMSTGIANAQDGGIVKIDFANITYDANGNVQSFAPNSARLIINEAAGGPAGALTVRQMTLNSGAVDRNGNALLATSYGKTVGLAFDPNGGTFPSNWPDAAGNFTQEPNLLFTSDGGAYAGTLFSTAPSISGGGSVAVLNGVTCGSTTVGVPANGSWLGVQLDIANFQPTLMGFTLCDALAYQPLIIDQNGFGRLPVAATQPNWDVDVFSGPFTPTFLFLSTGPTAPGGFVASVPTPFVPLSFTGDSWNDVFLLNGPFSLGLAVTDPFGYGTVSVPNPNTGGFTGFTLLVQGLALQPTGFQLSSPMLVQLQ
jgi:hypothetical protein